MEKRVAKDETYATDSITNSIDMNVSKLSGEKKRVLVVLQSKKSQRVRHNLATDQ